VPNISDATSGINPQRTVDHWDKVAVRIAQPLTRKQMKYLRANARSVDCRRGHPIRGSDQHWIVTLVAPNDAALHFMAELPHATVNYAEAARDCIYREHDEKRAVHALVDWSFVKPRHGKHQTVQYGEATYTGQRRPGLTYIWYSDRSSKPTGDEVCLHKEARFRGKAAVRRAGIHQISDLITFDHDGLWRAFCSQLYEVDLVRLGRWWLNKHSGQRRQQSRTVESGSFKYDMDRRTGAIIFHKYAAHSVQPLRSVQRFVDRFGRGPFLRKVQTSSLFMSDIPTRSHTSMTSMTNFDVHLTV
jgi:hypothetical protein